MELQKSAQANKPDWHIELQPVIVPVPEAFVRGEREFKPERNGCMIVYKAFPQDREFEKSVLWTHIGGLEVLAGRVVSKL